MALLSAAEQKPKLIHQQSFDEIIRNYLFVADFSSKEPERNVSDELFWKYPVTLPKVHFSVDFDLKDPKKEMPATAGDGMAFQHLNRGRILFQKGDFEEAKLVWLAGRARYGATYDFHRRNDYFIGQSFLQLAKLRLDEHGGDWLNPRVKSELANASTFLSYAFVVKEDLGDPLLDLVAPQQLYNLAATYYRYERYAGAFGVADRALNFLRKYGRSEYRAKLQRLLAEAHIRNLDYLSAVKELDSALRLGADKQQATMIFTRVGDIYFDLNNYELAAENYAIANRIDAEREVISPSTFVLLGESLFWLGKFSEAQKMFSYAMSEQSGRGSLGPLTPEYVGLAKLRIADAYLALKKYDEARLAYFDVAQEMRGTEVGRIARIRNACLELPEFDGNNVKHARESLTMLKDGEIPLQARELAWACHVASFTQRERTAAMVERVREFYSQYPESRFLGGLVEPVREVQAKKLDEYLQRKEFYSAVSFFEKNRELLFKDVRDETKVTLFQIYADIYQQEKAREFMPAYEQARSDDMALIRLATVVAELMDRKADKTLEKKNRIFAQTLEGRSWTLPEGDLARTYLSRLQTTTQSASHLLWLYNLYRTWSEKNSKLTCEVVYPLMTKLFRTTERKGSMTQMLRSDVESVVGKNLPELLRSDETCGISYLELEIQLFAAKPGELGAKYLTRRGWPMSEELAGLFWDVAERCHQVGLVQLSRELWTFVAEKGPLGSPKVAFAKSRLELRATEFEKLWAQ